MRHNNNSGRPMRTSGQPDASEKHAVCGNGGLSSLKHTTVMSSKNFVTGMTQPVLCTTTNVTNMSSGILNHNDCSQQMDGQTGVEDFQWGGGGGGSIQPFGSTRHQKGSVDGPPKPYRD